MRADETRFGADMLLLPWHATRRLTSTQAGRIIAALERDAQFARDFAMVRLEQSAVIALNENLGSPSSRVSLMLFAAIDAETRRECC